MPVVVRPENPAPSTSATPSPVATGLLLSVVAGTVVAFGVSRFAARRQRHAVAARSARLAWIGLGTTILIMGTVAVLNYEYAW